MFDSLKNNTYPGRGVLLGCTADGTQAVLAYFIMGRSVNSRNRLFIREGEGIRTEAIDPAKLSDPSLVIYAPVRVFGNHTIVTNGDQTDTIYDHLASGSTFEGALRTRCFEPDAPNFTPRISGMMTREENGISYQLSILKSADHAGTACNRFFYEYDQPLPGQGYLIHTYACDGDPIPSFTGEPTLVELGNCMEEFTEELWNALDGNNKVALFVRFMDIATGTYETKIINKG